MSQPFEGFCERELLFLEETVRAFAERYPANAKYLVPETGRSIDPHLDRLIEGFALLAGRVRHKLDSDFPELTESLVQILYPHLRLIIPSMAIAQASVPPGRHSPEGWRLEKETTVRSEAFGENAESFQYSLGYPVTVWPIDLAHVSWETSPFDIGMRPPRGTIAVLRMRFSCRRCRLPIDKPGDALDRADSRQRLLQPMIKCGRRLLRPGSEFAQVVIAEAAAEDQDAFIPQRRQGTPDGDMVFRS